jgi:ABC-2 type transport system ATP-binding protein
MNKEVNLEKSISKNQENEKVLEVKNLVKTFGKGHKKKVAVDDISFAIYKGKHLALLGSNGAGKTTTVDMISGITVPTSGKIEYLYPFERSFHEGLGIQFQDSSYPEGLSTKDIISFMLGVYNNKMSPQELEELLVIFGIKEFYKKPARSLSGGQQQRLNIVLSILHKPKFIILDELSTGLDIQVRYRIKKFIKDYAETHGITILLISHDMSEVEFLCKELIILSGGKIVAQDTIENIVSKYGRVESFVEKYIN